MGRPVSFDFTTGGGSPEEFLMGVVYLEPTLMHTIGSTVVLPDAPYPVKLVNGKAVHPDVAVSPAGPEPAWAYRVTIKNELTGKSWSEFRGVPTGTTQIAYKDLTKFVTTVPPQTTAGMMQNWADTTEANAERSELAADRAEAPTDEMNKNLIEDTASLTNAALSAAIVDRTGLQLWEAYTAYAIGQRVVHPDGSIKISKTNHTSGGTPGTLNWNDTAPLVEEKAARTLATERRRNAIRRESSGITSVVALPTAFGWAAPIRIAKTGRKYATDFDVAAFKATGGATWHVNYATGNDVTGTGAAGAPYKALSKAVQSAASGDTVIMHGTGVVYRDGGMQGTVISKTLNIVAETAGALKYVYADNLSYTLTSGRANVYQSARTNVTTVIDLRFSRDGIGYTKKTTEADVEATPGSWMQDGALVKVHQLGGGAPSSESVLALLSGDHFHAAPTTTDVALYMEGFDIHGGNHGVLFDATVGRHLDTYLKDLGVYWASYAGTPRNALNFFGTRYSYSQNVECAHGPKDGFNYTPYNVAPTLVDIPRAIEVNCHSFDHGVGNPIPGIENTHNATTGHGGAKIVRVGGRYHDTAGAVVADVQTDTKSVNYSCISFDSRATDTNYSNTWSLQQAGAEMWLYDCIGFGSSSDLYYLTGTTMRVDASEYDTASGGGTLDITNPA